MKTSLQKISPDEFILSVPSPQKRLDAAFEIAKTAFERSNLTVEDIQKAVKRIRKKVYGEKENSD